MQLATLQRNWDEFAKTDPLWSILTLPDKRFGNWDIDDFLETGRNEIEEVMQRIDLLNFDMKRGRALDFGCGVGRLTQALALHMSECHGVDISPTMIEHARTLNRHGDACQYHLNETDSLKLFPDDFFDFIYSGITLQHMEPDYAKRYIAEFVRLLVPGGLAVFQLPSELLQSRTELGPDHSAIWRALTNVGFKAKVTLLDQPSRVSAGAQFPLRLHVQNLSSVLWPAVGRPYGAYQIRLGNHWLRQDGTTAIKDDARSGLPRDLLPGEAVEVDLSVTAPGEPGEYLIEFDMVQEGVTWFAAMGSPVETARLCVEANRGRDDAYAPVMEMHGVPINDVIAEVEACGGEILYIQDDRMTGGPWISFRYFISKAPGR